MAIECCAAQCAAETHHGIHDCVVPFSFAALNHPLSPVEVTDYCSLELCRGAHLQRPSSADSTTCPEDSTTREVPLLVTRKLTSTFICGSIMTGPALW